MKRNLPAKQLKECIDGAVILALWRRDLGIGIFQSIPCDSKSESLQKAVLSNSTGSATKLKTAFFSSNTHTRPEDSNKTIMLDGFQNKDIRKIPFSFL